MGGVTTGMRLKKVRANRDSTLRRIDGSVGCNARVEPFWYSIGRLRSRIGFFNALRERWVLRRQVAAINTELKRQKVDPNRWDRVTGECVCNLRVAKMGLLHGLRTFASRQGADELRHLLRHRDRKSYYLPLDFSEPFVIVSIGEEIPVGSSLRLVAELKRLNEVLNVESSFGMKKMVDFLDATDRDISTSESRFGDNEGFWVRFGYVFLRKLAEKSVEHRMPIIFA